MSIVHDDYMAVDPEMERIWREDDEPSFTEIRSSMSEEETVEETQEEESEQPTNDVTDSVEEDTVDEEDDTDEADDSQSEDQESNATEDDKDVHVIKADGVELKLTTEEIRVLASKGIDYTKKTQALAPWRKQISAIQEANLGPNDINLMIDVLKGNKEAITEVLKRTKVDPLELDTDAKVDYVPNQYGKDEVTLAVEEVVSEISRDPEYQTTLKVVDDLWDSGSRQKMFENPALIRGLHEEIKMGRYEQVAPMAAKMKTMDLVRGNKALTDIEYYQIAVDQFIEQSQRMVQQEQRVSKQQEIKDKAPVRKAATTTRKTSGGKSVVDYLDDNDEDFNDWYKKVMSKR